MSKKKKILLLLLVILLLQAAFLFKVRFKMADFAVFYQAGERFSAGEILYRSSDGHYQFKYPPFFALLMAPLALLPYPLACQAWFWLIVAALVSMFRYSLGMLPQRQRNIFWLVFIPLLVLGRFYAREISLGQANALMNASLLFMLAAFIQRKSWRCSLSLSLAAAIKPYALIFIPYFLFKKRFREVAITFAGLLLVLLMPALFYGWKGNLALLHQWRLTLGQSSPGLFGSFDNVSLLGFFTKWGKTISPGLLGVTVMMIAVLLFWLVIRKRSECSLALNEYLDGAGLLVLIPLFSPLGWDYTFISATAALILLVNYQDLFPGPWRWVLFGIWILIGVGLYDLWGRELFLRYMHWSVLTLCFTALLFFLSELKKHGTGFDFNGNPS